MQAMLSKPAAGSRQLIGLCFCLLENIELTSVWEALARDTPSRIGGQTKVLHLLTPLTYSPPPPAPPSLPGGRKLSFCGMNNNSRRELEFGSSTQTTVMPRAPVYSVFIRETFIEWLLWRQGIETESLNLIFRDDQNQNTFVMTSCTHALTSSLYQLFLPALLNYSKNRNVNGQFVLFVCVCVHVCIHVHLRVGTHMCGCMFRKNKY